MDAVHDMPLASPDAKLIAVGDIHGQAEALRRLLDDLPYNTACVYSFSKYFGATGWRLAVIATAQREYVPVVLVNGETNFYLRASDGSYATWYNYGNSNAPVALGRPVTLPAGADCFSQQKSLPLAIRWACE